MTDTTIERITDQGGADRAVALIDEYLAWASGEVVRRYDLPTEQGARLIAEHRERFAEDLPGLLGPAGRLLVAARRDRVVGVVGLSPAEPGVGEVKRLFVHPDVRGTGLGRALLEDLVAAARGLGLHRVRLETMEFMVDAIALYRALGFVPISPPGVGEGERSGLTDGVLWFSLDLPR